MPKLKNLLFSKLATKKIPRKWLYNLWRLICNIQPPRSNFEGGGGGGRGDRKSWREKRKKSQSEKTLDSRNKISNLPVAGKENEEENENEKEKEIRQRKKAT